MGDTDALAPLPHLDGDHIAALAGRWSDGGLWADVAWCADRFWASTGPDRRVAWHHLVLAVGNFKRQPGRRLRPAPLCDEPPVDTRRADRVAVPSPRGDVTVDVDEPASWAALTAALPGAALATTTTLLAALWPDSHLVADWRVFSAATGLRVAAGDPTAPERSSTVPVPANVDTYADLRHRLRSTAEAHRTELVTVERALYELSRAAGTSPGRSWGGYADALLTHLGALER